MIRVAQWQGSTVAWWHSGMVAQWQGSTVAGESSKCVKVFKLFHIQINDQSSTVAG
jgi:hypothetical protein